VYVCVCVCVFVFCWKVVHVSQSSAWKHAPVGFAARVYRSYRRYVTAANYTANIICEMFIIAAFITNFSFIIPSLFACIDLL